MAYEVVAACADRLCPVQQVVGREGAGQTVAEEALLDAGAEEVHRVDPARTQIEPVVVAVREVEVDLARQREGGLRVGEEVVVVPD